MSIHYYRPELNAPKPENVVGEITSAWGGEHYFVKTTLELKGRGIKLVSTLDENNCNNPDKHDWNQYKVTNRAMDILGEKYEFSMELLFD